MNEKILLNKIVPLSSRITKSKSVSSIFQKINTERNQRNKKIIKYSSIDNESRFNRNKSKSDRKLISSSSYNNIKIIDDKKFHNNIYQDIDLNSAPSYNDNISEIRKMINGQKYNNLRNMYAMYLNSPFPKEYLKDIKHLNKRKILIMSKNNRNLNLLPFKRNNSCEDLFDENIKLKSIITEKAVTARMSPINTKNNIDTNKNTRNTNRNNSKLSPNIKNNYSNLSTTTNKSLITLKFQDKQSESNVKSNQESIPTSQNNIILPKIPILNSHNSIKTTISDSEKNQIESPKNQPSFLTELALDKMKFNINNLIIDKSKKKRESIDKYEEKILKLKIYQTYQKEKLEELLNNEELYIQEKIDHIIKMYKLYDNIYETYMDNIVKYNRFLFKILYDIELELRKIRIDKKNINYQIEVLINKIIEKQIVFEYLISARNFLFLVKNRDKKIINMDKQYIHKVSNRRQLVIKLFDLFGRTEDSFAFKYLKKLIPLDILEKIIGKKVFKKSNSTLRGSNSNKHSTIILDEGLSPPPPGVKIFQSPEDFINILNSMTNNDLELISNYQKLEEDKKELTAELKENIAFYQKSEKSELNNNIIKNEKILEEEKQKYNKLTKKYEYFNDLFIKKKELSSLQLDFKIFSYKSFNNIYFFNKIQYNKLRVKYKIEGLVLLEKLINNVNEILRLNKKINVFDLNEIYHYVPQSILNQILVLKIDYFDKDNQYLINEYTLKLLKLYGYFGEFLTNRNEQMKNFEHNIYMKVREKVLNERRIYNAQIVKRMINEKRENTLKELKEKWDKNVIKKSKISEIYIKQNPNKSVEVKDLKENLKSIEEEQEKINLLNFEEN